MPLVGDNGLIELFHQQLVHSGRIVQVYYASNKISTIMSRACIQGKFDVPWCPAPGMMCTLPLRFPAFRRFSMAVMPPAGSIQSCSPSARFVLCVALNINHDARTYKRNGYLERCDAVHQRTACVCTRGEYMR